MLNSASIWFIIGILLLLSEFLIPGFTIFFFGLGGLLTSIVLLIFPIDDIYWIQVLIFLISSIILLITLRRKFTKTLRGELFQEKNDYVDQECMVIEGVSENKKGRILYNGTTWDAFSIKGRISKNSRAVIIGKKDHETMVFLIKKIKKEK